MDKKLSEFYKLQYPITAENLDQIVPMMTDRLIWQGVVQNVQARLKASAADTFLYHFNYNSLVLQIIKYFLIGKVVPGVVHAEELLYLFNIGPNRILPAAELAMSILSVG